MGYNNYNDCNNCNDCDCNEIECGCKLELSSNCVIYEGSDLACLNIKKGDRLESVIDKLETLKCDYDNSNPVVDIETDNSDPYLINVTFKDNTTTQIVIPNNSITDTIEYTYTAFASDLLGTDFSTNPADATSRCYMSIITSLNPLTPVASDFTGKWFKYRDIQKEYVDSNNYSYPVTTNPLLNPIENLNISPILIPKEYFNAIGNNAEVKFYTNLENTPLTFNSGQILIKQSVNGNADVLLADMFQFVDTAVSHTQVPIIVKTTLFRKAPTVVDVINEVVSQAGDDSKVFVTSIVSYTIANTSDITIDYKLENQTSGDDVSFNSDGETVRSINTSLGC